MYVYIFDIIYVCIYIYMNVSIYIYLHIYIYIYTYIHICFFGICMYIRKSINRHIYIYMYIDFQVSNIYRKRENAFIYYRCVKVIRVTTKVVSVVLLIRSFGKRTFVANLKC